MDDYIRLHIYCDVFVWWIFSNVKYVMWLKVRKERKHW